MHAAYGTWGYAEATTAPTVGKLDRAVSAAMAGGPITSIPTAPAVINLGSANAIGANLRLAYWFAIAGRYLEGTQSGTGWGPDASTQAKGWAGYYLAQAKSGAARRWSPTARLTDFGHSSPAVIQGMFVKGAKWVEGYDLGTIGAQLRSLGQPARTRQAQALYGGDTIIPSGLPDAPENPLDKLLKTLKTAGIVGGVSVGVLGLGIAYLALRKT
jgi:hypothetical protein